MLPPKVVRLSGSALAIVAASTAGSAASRSSTARANAPARVESYACASTSYQELTDHPAASGAKRAPHRDLPFALDAAGHEEVGNVRACHAEHEQRNEHQDSEDRSGFPARFRADPARRRFRGHRFVLLLLLAV